MEMVRNVHLTECPKKVDTTHPEEKLLIFLKNVFDTLLPPSLPT